MDSDWQVSCKTIQDATSYLLKSKKLTDVTFVVGDDEEEKIEAHKLILMARSPVFEAMFERWESGQDCRIEVPEISGKSFQMFLKFLYANEFVVTRHEAAEVLYLAHKYNTPELATKCSDLLKSVMDIKNVVHIHQVATRLEQEALRSKALEFILQYGKPVLQDPGFIHIDVDTLCTLLQKDELVTTDELSVFHAVMRWAENKCRMQNMQCTIENKRIVLNEVIHLIRFPTMSPQEFTDEVIGKHRGLLSDSEIDGIYIYFNHGSKIESELPQLPFSRIKRLSATIYTVSPYQNVTSIENIKSGVYGRYGYPEEMCKPEYRFTASMNIRVTAIELFEQTAGLERFTISVYSVNRPRAIIYTKRRPKSSTIFDLNEAVYVPKGVCCIVKLTVNGTRSIFIRDKPTAQLASSWHMYCGKDSISFSFSSTAESCNVRRRSYYGGDGTCICTGQIKAIHFTL